MILVFLSGTALFSVGFYVVFCEILQLPTGKAVRAMRSAARQDGKSYGGEAERVLSELSDKLKWLIKLDSVRKAAMENALRIAKQNVTAEAFVLSLFILAVGIFLVFVFLAVFMHDAKMIVFGLTLGGALAALRYRQILGSVGSRREKIVSECPRFAGYLTQNLSVGNRDLPGILEAYTKTASCPEFADELSTTVADMKTGNYERALFNFQHRVDHPAVTEIVRGLQGVLHGDDQTLYFERVCFDMKTLEQSLLKKEAGKRPRKITKYQFFIMAGTILMMIVALVTQLVDNLSVLFG